MLRGEFIRGDGLVIPNNITTYGIRMIFQWGLVGTGYDLHVGLANCNPDPLLDLANIGEPTIATNGYARQPIPQNAGGWPIQGQFNGEQYYETATVIFEAAGGNFDAAINRLALINSLGDVVGAKVVALSGTLPDELTITPTTLLADRSFKYRIYGR